MKVPVSAIRYGITIPLLDAQVQTPNVALVSSRS